MWDAEQSGENLRHFHSIYLDRIANTRRRLWRELFTRAAFLIGLPIGRGRKQGD
jgi:hypothetical protein